MNKKVDWNFNFNTVVFWINFEKIGKIEKEQYNLSKISHILTKEILSWWDNALKFYFTKYQLIYNNNWTIIKFLLNVTHRDIQ